MQEKLLQQSLFFGILNRLFLNNRRIQNEKIITSLLILAALFCLAGCPGETGSSNTTTPVPQIDTTTLDGTYVITYTLGGKDINAETIVIDGTSFTVSQVDITVDSAAELDAATQQTFPAYTIAPEGNSCSIEEEPGTTITFTMITDNTGTWLTSDYPYFTENYKKVVPGTLGTPTYVIDYYFSADNKLLMFTQADSTISVKFRDPGYSNGSGITYNSSQVQKNGNTYTVSGNDWSYTVTVDGTTATVSNASDFFNGTLTTPAGTYTRYVRSTDWPVVAAE